MLRMILSYIDANVGFWDNDLPFSLEKYVIELGDLSIGEKAKIIGYSPCDLQYRRKLLVMGLTPGTEVTLIGIAPLGDPVEISTRGHSLCLRKSEAHILQLEKLV